MKKLLTVVLLLVSFFISSFSLAAVNQGYEDDKGYSTRCPSVGQRADTWCFFTCNCTSYVAWKLNQYFTERPASNPLFTNSYYGLSWGSAYNWKRLVDDETFAHFSRQPVYMSTSSPSYPWASYGNGGVFDVRAAVAWWDSSGGSCGSGGLSCGHVAFIETINWKSDHTVDSIVVSEYNFNVSLQYTASRTINSGTSDYPDGFLYLVTDTWQECDLTGLCQGNGSCGGGSGGGSLPDFIIKNIWLSDSSGNVKTVFAPGEAMQIHIEVKNVGADTQSGIDVEYFRSNGYYKDSDPTNVGTDFIHKDDLEEGETHNELKNTTAPMIPGRYNMTAQADSGHDVSEEHEGNNWSDEAVFTVSQPSTPKRVRHWLKLFPATSN